MHGGGHASLEGSSRLGGGRCVGGLSVLRDRSTCAEWTAAAEGVVPASARLRLTCTDMTDGCICVFGNVGGDGCVR